MGTQIGVAIVWVVVRQWLWLASGDLIGTTLAVFGMAVILLAPPARVR
jgi:drug/metabolite transporter superfamily protein YnfA